MPDAAKTLASLRRILGRRNHWLDADEAKAVQDAITLIERATPKPIFYGYEAVCVLTNLADRFEHPEKYAAEWHKKTAKILVALAVGLSIPSNRRLDILVRAAEEVEQEAAHG